MKLSNQLSSVAGRLANSQSYTYTYICIYVYIYSELQHILYIMLKRKVLMVFV